MTAVILFLFIAYYLLLISLLIGWHKATLNKDKATWNGANKDTISLVIAARNEEKVIPFLLEDISRQKYGSFEVIIVDDQSEDKTCAVVEEFLKNDNRFFLKRSSGAGKKRALTEGIQMARGSIIVTTDADCRVSEHWLDGLSRYFSDDRIKMVFGGVRIKTYSLFSQLQSLEFLSVIGSGAAMAALGLPVMCNGANLAFRKSTFEEVGGYNGNFHIPSGDDEFLMRKMLSRYPAGIRFASARDCTVTTVASNGLRAFINQRIRWAGKWKFNQSLGSKLLALFVLCFQLCLLSLPVFVLTGMIGPWLAVGLWLVKVSMESFFLCSIGRFVAVSWHWPAFLLLQFIYPLYITMIGIFSNFRAFEWKGRKLKSLMVSRY